VRSRQITDADIDGVVDLLARGFRLRPRGYWQHALEKLSSHQAPPDMPKFGYLLESGGDPVGVISFIRRFPVTLQRKCAAMSRAGTSSPPFEAMLPC
jgi:hypothetical protein